MPLELRGLHRSLMIVKPSIAFNDFAGTAKDVTARNVKGRNILSSRAQHSKIVTPAQAVSRNRLSKISRTFRQLSDSQINQWEVLAGHMKGISTFGKAAELTAHNAFIRINTNLQMVGEPMLADAPLYIADVPEVLYEDLWISPDMIVFTGLEQPSESHVLVFKMTPALSPGVSSGWGQTVIITPGMAPDWGDADVTALYTSVMGVAPEAGKKYFCEFYWLDKKTGFTGESMAISAICKESSTAYQTEYVPRARVTLNEVADSQGFETLDFELSHGSTILSVDAQYSNNTGVASGQFILKKTNKSIPDFRSYVLGRCSSHEREKLYRPCLFAVWIHTWRGETEGTFAHRAGEYYSENAEVFGSAPIYKY